MKNLILFLSASFFFITGLNAQSTANYSFSSVATGTLTPMTGATNLITGSATSNVASSVANIGFTFYYMGTSYTQFSVNSNGQMRLGATGIAGTAQTPATSTALLVPFNGSNLLPTGGLAQYVVTGANPNRILTVEWLNIVIPTAGTTSRFQVRLHESAGVIDYIYGTMYNNKATALVTSIYHSSSTAGSGTIGSVASINTNSPTYSSTLLSTTNLTASSAIPNLTSVADGSRRIFTFSPPAATIAPNWAVTPITNLTGNGMTLNWNDNSTTETGYQIYNSTDNVTFTLVGTTAANITTYTATGLKDVTTYYWKVVAFNEGTAPTSTSVISQTTPLAAPTWAATPVNLPTITGMTLNWIDNSSNETGYKIYNSTDNITFNLVTTTAANTTTYAAIGLSIFTVYYWKIAAVSGATTSAFTPVSSFSTLDTAPVAPTWAVTPISNPTTAGMTLTWMDNSTNETGFEIYRSTDNITFTKIATTSANATSYTASGLTISTLYYWKVDAVNSNGSSAQTTTSSLSTTASSSIISVATGNWSSGSTWSSGGIPAITDDVIISTGNTVTLDAAANTAKTLTVNGSLVYNPSTSSTLTVNGSITVSSGGSFTSPLSGSVTTHLLNIGGSVATGVGGNLVVNGVFDMNAFSTAAVSVIFFGSPSNTITGSGSTINFYSIVVNKGSSNISILDIQSVITLATATSSSYNKLSATAGTIKISSASVLSPYYGSVSINSAGNGVARLWINNAAAVVQSVGAGTVGGSTGVSAFNGMLQIDAGTFSFGNGATSLSFTNNLSLGGVNATFNMYGCISTGSTTNFNITAGNINVYPQLGVNKIPTGSLFSPVAAFNYTANQNYSGFTFTGGMLTIVDPNPNSGAYDASLTITGAGVNLAGSTIRFGDGISDSDGSASGYMVNVASNVLGNVIVNNYPGSTKTTRNITLLSNINVGGNLTINSGTANKLALSTFALTLTGNMTNGGTIISNNVSTNGLVFNGTTKQTVTNTGIFLSNIPNLTINNTSGSIPAVDLQVPLTVSTGLTLTNGQLGSSNASVLTLGNSGVSATLLMTRSGGSLATLPSFALAGVTFSVTYVAPLVAASITTGFELPASANIGTFTVNNLSGVVLDKPAACTSLALTSGILTSDVVNKVTVTGTLPTNITGGSTTSYINGPLTLTIPNNATIANYKFPIGKTIYHLFEFSGITTGGTGNATFTAEAFDTGPYSGIAGTGLSAINTDKYWILTGTLGSVTIISSNVRLSDTGLLSINRIGQSNNATGTYNSIGGTVTGGTTIASNNPVDYSAIGTGTCFREGSATSISSGTYAIGPQISYAGYAGTYSTLSSAVNAITSVPLSGNIIFEFQSDYVPAVEIYPVALTTNINSNVSASVTFRPAASVVSVINFSGTTSILTNSGADYVIFDGRNGGTGTNQYFQFTSSSTTAATIVLSGDAQNNQILYTTLKGSTTAASTGILTLNTPTSGNNFLKVDHCNFDASSTANNCLYTTGLATNDTITNNNFHDYRNGAGINIVSGSNNAVIDNNNFYQTTNYAGFAGTTSGIILTGGNNVRISNNNIGGSGPALAGVWTVSATTPAAYNFTGINATSLATTSKIYNNKIRNFDWKCTPSTWTGITASGVVNIGTDGSNVIGTTTGNDSIKVTYFTTNGAAQINGIVATSGTTVNIENNTVGSITTLLSGVTGVGSSITCISNNATTGTVRNNILGSTTIAKSINAANQTATGNTQNIFGIVAGGTTNTVTGNTIANMYSDMTFASTTAGMIRGIKITNGNYYSVTSNSIYSLSSPQPMTGFLSGGSSYHNIVGIDINASNNTGLCNITGNTIYDLTNTSTTAAVYVLGIYCQTSSSNGAIFDKNYIHSFSTASNTAIQTGIHLNYGGPCTIQNNVIRLGIDKAGNSITSTAQINGIIKAAGYACNIYFNTVYIGGSGVTAGTVKTYAFFLSSHVTEDIRNNIFVNARTNAVANPLNYAVYLTGTLTSGFNSDYNIYNVSSTDGKLATVNAVDVLTLNTLKNTLPGYDIHSGFGDPLLVSPTAALATLDLHPAISTETEGTGTFVSTVTDDFTGALRSTNTPTDIGAYSGNFTLASLPMDIFSPAVSYSNLGNGSMSTSRLTANFAVIIDNVNGINLTSGTKPRFYYKLSTDNNVFGGNTSSDNGWKWVEATGSTIPFNFNIDYSILNGGSVGLGSTIQYFVVAQNLATVPVVSFNPSIGASGTSVATVLTAPTTPNSFTIVLPFPSSVNVGTGQTYTTLTGAGGLFASINAGTIHANTVAFITSDITEPGTTSLNLVSEEGTNAGALTLIIKSDSLANHVISGTAVSAGAPMIPITGAIRLLIDGGKGKMLTFRNTNTTASSTGPVIQFSNNSQCTFQNCIVESNSTSASTGAITIGTGTNIVTLKNNDIRDARGGTVGSPTTGIYSSTATNAVTIISNNIYNQLNVNSYGLYLLNVAVGSTITGNSFYCENGKIASGAYTGIYLVNSNNLLISGNYIGGSAPACGGSVPFTISGFVTFTGISISNSSALSTTVQGNTIQNISMTNTSGPVFNGINNVSYGSVNLIRNVIGSVTTANSILIAGAGASAGINQTYNYVLYPCTFENNTIANITLTNVTGTPVFYGMKTYSNRVRSNSIYNIGTSANIGVTIYGIYNYFNNTNSFTNEFSNNVISLNGGASTTPTIYGFYENSTYGTTGFYFNSINISGTSSGTTSSYAFYRNAAGIYNFSDNILVNSRTGGTGLNYAFYSLPTTLFTSNYNDFYVSGTTLGHWGTAGTTNDNSNLAALKIASSQDANSVSIDPLFSSPTSPIPDLTLQAGSPLISAGKTVSGIPADIAGTLRNVTNPTLGAYEYYVGNRLLNLTSVLLEGLYNGAGTLRQARDELGNHWPMGVADHITVELHSSTSYATIVFPATDVPLSITGAATLIIPAQYTGNYYITIKHRNSLETTTAVPESFAGSTINQSFGLPTNVFGGNLGVSTDGNYLIYAGDVNQDGFIDSQDYIGVDNDLSNFTSGYLPTDVDGNGTIDSRDVIAIDNSNYNFTGTSHP